MWVGIAERFIKISGRVSSTKVAHRCANASGPVGLVLTGASMSTSANARGTGSWDQPHGTGPRVGGLEWNWSRDQPQNWSWDQPWCQSQGGWSRLAWVWVKLVPTLEPVLGPTSELVPGPTAVLVPTCLRASRTGPGTNPRTGPGTNPGASPGTNPQCWSQTVSVSGAGPGQHWCWSLGCWSLGCWFLRLCKFHAGGS